MTLARSIALIHSWYTHNRREGSTHRPRCSRVEHVDFFYEKIEAIKRDRKQSLQIGEEALGGLKGKKVTIRCLGEETKWTREG